ncbi:MAG: histidinol-phosphate transaminase [Clostridiaceae bacterium]
MTDNIKPNKRSTHGGDIYTGSEGVIFTDLSSNINPGSIPGEVYEKLPEMLEMARAYPDLEYKRLKEGLSKYLTSLSEGTEYKNNITSEMIIVGNGASEVTDKYISLFKRIVLPVPSFKEYELSANRYGIDTAYIDIYPDKEPRDTTIKDSRGKSFFERIKKEMNPGSLLILTNPNNPDGQKLKITDLIDYLEAAEKQSWFTLIDETFGEYLGNSDMALNLTGRFNNLAVVKAMTKFFCLPGLRLGYMVTKNQDLLSRLDQLQTPWSVGTFEENIALIMLKDKAFRAESIAENEKNKAYLLENIKNIDFFSEVYHSDSNFVMLRLRENCGTAKKLAHFLRSKNILVRELSDMQGLSGDYIRIAVKDREKTDLLLVNLMLYIPNY